MKYTFLCAFLSAGILIGCSHVQDTKRIPTSINHVGVIEQSEVLLYYKEGDYIIVKACDPNTILGTTPAQAENSCQGKSNKVPVEHFKQSLHNLVSTDQLNVLRPLTPEEVEAYNKDDSNSDQVEAMMIELEKINNVISFYGAENANLVRKEELVKALRSQEMLVSVIKKINAEVEKTVNLIADQAKLTLIKFNPDKDQFLYTVLKQFNPNEKYPCGRKGSVYERIKDCSYQLTSEGEGFVLVTRSEDFKEVYQEISTGRLWSDRLPLIMNHNNAKTACNADLKEVAGISGVTWRWRLPSIDDYKYAENNGIRATLPNMNYKYWTSSTYGGRFVNDGAWLYNGLNGQKLYEFMPGFEYSVRCVAH